MHLRYLRRSVRRLELRLDSANSVGVLLTIIDDDDDIELSPEQNAGLVIKLHDDDEGKAKKV